MGLWLPKLGRSNPRVGFVCDGALWIWDLVSHHYSNATQIVDWYHTEEHLKKFADAVFPSLEERRDWLETVTEMLWQGQIEEVILACQSIET